MKRFMLLGLGLAGLMAAATPAHADYIYAGSSVHGDSHYVPYHGEYSTDHYYVPTHAYSGYGGYGFGRYGNASHGSDNYVYLNFSDGGHHDYYDHGNGHGYYAGSHEDLYRHGYDNYGGHGSYGDHESHGGHGSWGHGR